MVLGWSSQEKLKVIKVGVYHVSGLGTSPGAVTMPLTCVYILQAAARLGHRGASDFFKFSGESEKKGSYEKAKGQPEALIVFDSKEAIEGKLRLNYSSGWFNLKPKNSEPVHEPIVSYLCKLIGKLNDTLEKNNAEGLKPPKYFYLVKVDYQNFDDVFVKAGALYYAIRRKEVWTNLIGGSNQINLALMISGAYTAVPSRYYYVFQNSNRLEPEWLSSLPKDANKINAHSYIILEKWYQFPPLNLGIGTILRELTIEFQGKSVINKKEVEDILEKRGYTEKFLPKLIEAGYIIPEGEEGFKKGPFIEKYMELFGKLEDYREKLDSISKWKKEFRDIIEEGNFEC
ncbi:hypothetical protein [Thermococcus sp. MAR1]|uniref:hypothetical protein n=1 Tax=Thermococcus sp. MAR1 TaxID=1638263 RepID=UPI001438C2D7|nr:hypothetical protein [Thermococcus sp. MAR1]NJE10069.1 hypothetical protein [Thermococcus sp. MAR1]